MHEMYELTEYVVENDLALQFDAIAYLDQLIDIHYTGAKGIDIGSAYRDYIQLKNEIGLDFGPITKLLYHYKNLDRK